MSRDASQISSDRRLWLSEPGARVAQHGPACGCRTRPWKQATSGGAAEVSRTSRSCERCGDRLAAGLRAEARAIAQSAAGRPASRERLRQRSGRAGLRPPERCALLPGPDTQRRATRGALLLKALPAGPPPALGSRTRTSQGAKRARRPPVSSSNPPGVSDVSRDVSLPCRDAGNAARRRLELVLHVEDLTAAFPVRGSLQID